MSAVIRRYRMGTYVLSHSTPKAKLGVKFQRIKASKRRRNMTYAGSLTKYRKSKRQKELSVILLIALIIFIANIAMTELNSLNTRKFTIINDQAVTAQVETATSVELESKEENLKFSSTLPVLVETPEQEIRKIAKELNFKWPDYLVKLSKCESSLNPKAINKNKNGTADKGIFQINDVHGLSDEFRYNIRNSTEWTINKINQGEQHIWVCNSIILK